MKNYIPALLWAVIIFVLSTGAKVQLTESIFSADKLGHFTAYFLLCWLFLWANRRARKEKVVPTVQTIIAVSLYGTVLEFVQWQFFPDRFFEVWDMIANITGACFAAIVFVLKHRKDMAKTEN